jgi:tetratricopeptide (TPR) repeat protein
MERRRDHPSGLRDSPNDPDLWAGLGSALVAHSNGMMNPAAEQAFRRAEQLAPGHPAPRFYYGLALTQGGQFAEAERIWRQLLAEAPPDADYRQTIEQQLQAIRQAQLPEPPAARVRAAVSGCAAATADGRVAAVRSQGSGRWQRRHRDFSARICALRTVEAARDSVHAPRLCRAAQKSGSGSDAALAYIPHLAFEREADADGNCAVIQRDDVALHLFSEATMRSRLPATSSQAVSTRCRLSERGARIVSRSCSSRGARATFASLTPTAMKSSLPSR